MALAIITTLVVLPLVLLVVDLLRPARKEPAAFAGPPTGKQRPVPAFIPQEPLETVTVPQTLVSTLPQALPTMIAPPSAVRAPIGAASAQHLPGGLLPRAEVKLPQPHLVPRAPAPSALLATVPATAGTAPALELPPHRPSAAAEPLLAVIPREPAADLLPDRIPAVIAELEAQDQVEEQRRRRGVLTRGAKKGPLAPTGGRRDYFGDGLLAGTVAQRTDAA